MPAPRQVMAHPGSPLQQFTKLLYAKAGLPDDGTHRTRLEVPPAMYRHRHRARRITRISENMVAACDSVDNVFARLRARTTALPLATGSRPPAMARRLRSRVGFQYARRQGSQVPDPDDMRGRRG